MRQTFLKFLTAFAVSVMAASAMAAPMVTNGDFESDTGGFSLWPGYVGQDGVNPANVSGWQGTGGHGINPISSAHDTPAPFRDNGSNDTHVAFLQGASSIFQDVSGFTPGAEYILSLDYNSRNCCGDFPVATVSLSADLSVSTGDAVMPVGDANDWYHADIPFVAPADTLTLTISSAASAGGDATLVVDNVSIQAVPEPASMGLIGIGLLGFMMRRRR
ncbi:MAG: PEP-CTERM sorting domain-containing protein [Planctomycetales bacterium]|nr:PEP-CTERM sorting domain-containing protein [Planctomycetales bacterium]